MTQINQLGNRAIALAIAGWLSDPELIDWLQQKWQQSNPEQIQNTLGVVQNQLISDLSHNQIILLNFNQSIFLIGIEIKTLLLWTKQTETIGVAVLHSTPYWYKSAFDF